MSRGKNQKIKKQDLIDDFHERVQAVVSANTQWVYSTAVWNSNVGNVIGNSVAFGGAYNRSVSPVVSPESISVDDLINKITAAGNKAGSIISVLKDFTKLYTYTHMVNLLNTGNVAPASYTGIVQMDGVPTSVIDDINASIDAAAIAHGVIPGTKVKADSINAFVEACRNLWISKCTTSALENFYYGFCHSSCHSNLTCYNSRGRR